jgi:hypothetical protein
MDGAVEMIGVGEGLMGKEVALEVAPGSLDVVQFRGVFRQPFDDEPGPRRESRLPRRRRPRSKSTSTTLFASTTGSQKELRKPPAGERAPLN